MPHGSAIKPILTDQQKLTGVFYSAEQICKPTSGDFKFEDANNKIHIDKNFVYPKSHYVYLIQKEVDEGKRPKIMFFCTKTWSCFDDNGTCLFDGKISC